ncbi:MAG: DUF4131 domain-containing protein, partial [Myxococcota bacterium]
MGIVLAERGALRLEAALAFAIVVLVHGCVWPGLRARASLALLLALAAGAIGVGMVRARAGPELAAPWRGVVEATVADAVRTGARWRVDLENVVAVAPGPEPAPGPRPELPRRVRLRGERVGQGVSGLEALSPGSRVRALVRLRPPSGLRNPGARDAGLALRRA